MSEILSQNLNIRTTLAIKKRVMEEADKREMKMSEYILFILESFWNKSLKNDDDQELIEVRGELKQYQQDLMEAQAKVTTLTSENDKLEEALKNEPKGIWQEATETSAKLSEEFIQDERERAVRAYKQEHLSEIARNENFQIQLLSNRLKQYETPLLKSLFEITRHNPKVRDLPDVVSVLTQNYYQQFIQNQYHES